MNAQNLDVEGEEIVLVLEYVQDDANFDPMYRVSYSEMSDQLEIKWTNLRRRVDIFMNIEKLVLSVLQKRGWITTFLIVLWIYLDFTILGTIERNNLENQKEEVI